jgi:hypothetical protein
MPEPPGNIGATGERAREREREHEREIEIEILAYKCHTISQLLEYREK